MNQYLKALWLTETVRLIEKESGRFLDDDANRIARSEKGSVADRIVKRAELIGEKNGLKQAQTHWLNSTKISLLILLIIAIFGGVGLGFSALANNPVNLYRALLCLLGVHFVTLLLWLMSSIFIPNESGSLFIHIWLFLAKKLSQKRTVSLVLPAFITLFSKHTRWLVGLIVNVLWTVMLFSALVILVILLSTKSYSFEWQTTLLSPDSVITITHFLGWLPSALGFSLPDTEMIRVSEHAMTDAEIRSSWAIWLLGIFIVYGVAIRLILSIFCGLKWLGGCQNITLNMQYPEYQLLANELQPIVVKSIVDKEGDHPLNDHDNSVTHVITGTKQLLVALDVEQNWLPPADVEFLGFINSNEQRKLILILLQQSPAQKLLIAIDTDRTPDRGMIHLIQSLRTQSNQSKLWFINHGRQWDNWQESLLKLSMQSADPRWLFDNSGDQDG